MRFGYWGQSMRGPAHEIWVLNAFSQKPPLNVHVHVDVFRAAKGLFVGVNHFRLLYFV